MISNTQELQSRARELALTHELAHGNVRIRPFWATFKRDMVGLEDFARRLSDARATCTQPAEDWLLDHMGFLEAHTHAVLRKLPRRVLHQLPKLKDTGLPRIYGICDAYLDAVGGSYNAQTFESYILAYQDVSVLKLLECWQLPAALSVVIVKHLAEAMREVRYRHDVCHSTAALLAGVRTKVDDGPEAARSENEIRGLLAQHFGNRPLGPAEVVHILRHLGEEEPNVKVLRDWLAAYVENSDSSLARVVSLEHELQASIQVSCGNLIQGLHEIERQPWHISLQKISRVHQILLADVARDFRHLDDASQDLLRNQVAEVAGRLRVPEALVAQTAVNLAGRQRQQFHPTPYPREDSGQDRQRQLPPRSADIAYYLLDIAGRDELRRHVALAARPRKLPALAPSRYPGIAYAVGAGLLFLILVAGGVRFVTWGTSPGPWTLPAVVAGLLWPASEWAVTALHAAIGGLCKPRPLPRYDFSKALPEDAKTMVVVPIIWGSTDEVDEVVNRLQVHYFANRQPNIYFAILADFRDSPKRETAADGEILRHAVRRVEELRAKYGAGRFFLFHRSRRYNAADKVYMGWERKRGKLVEFVDLLCGNENTSFTTICGDREVLPDIQYVLTVDSDTQLPFGAVGRLAGTIHLPYNRPRLDEHKTQVVEGYGVLQPRVGVSWESTQKSRFAALWAGAPGIDPYAFAASNPYQDLFGQGIFVGKGIFAVGVFQQVLVNRIPENQVLSHDILEGGFLRAALASDIEVVEEYPTTFYAYQHRAHRWIRGDWQLIPWLGKRYTDRLGRRRPNHLPGLARWQILDNLRRSLLAPALFLLALLGTGPLPGRTLWWETIVLITVFLPFLQEVMKGVGGKASWRTLVTTFCQSAVSLFTLPFATVMAVDAITRALYRMYITREKLLEWATSARINRKTRTDALFVNEPTVYALVVLFPVLAWWWGVTPGRIVGTVGFFLWISAHPLVAWLNHSQPKRRRWVEAARSELVDLAHDIWMFFEHYVTADESWLPPDNVQFYPEETIAHRTSPTNIGLYLVSVLAAKDLGFIDEENMLQRFEHSLDSIVSMEKWNGHLLNWYNTQTLEALAPRYVSTVDSGNLVAYFMVLRQALSPWNFDSNLQGRVQALAEKLDALIEQTDFAALYNPQYRLFHLGYKVDGERAEGILYDLLASEARQASLVAIALGQVPASHWFTLGRTMTRVGRFKTLLSWSGTMFEYLMPALILRTYRNTLWDVTFRGVVQRQRSFAKPYDVPFGVSESGYYAFDYMLNYQYRAFGVPGLGFAQKLENDLVTAPYATILSLPLTGETGIKALHEFRTLGARGKYGYFEAVDFTRRRLPHGRLHRVIESFMAHHQGMSFLALVNLLLDDIMVERFHSDLRVQAARLLLQERVPETVEIVRELPHSHAKFPALGGAPVDGTRRFEKPTLLPEINLLSNGRLSSLTTNRGYGVIQWHGLALTRGWTDSHAHESGPAFYIRDLTSDAVYNLVSRGTPNASEARVTVFQLDKTNYTGNFETITYSMDVVVCSNIDAEVRKIELTNRSEMDRWLEATSFFELALTTPEADRAHPAFSKLFVETSEAPDEQCLLARRRIQSSKDEPVWVAQTMQVTGGEPGKYEFETDRAAFIGRGRSLDRPKGLFASLGQSLGAVVDPAFVLRRTVHLAPQSSCTIYVVTGAGSQRYEALAAVQQVKEAHQVDNAFHLAWMRVQIDLRYLHLSAAEAMAAQMLAGRLTFPWPWSEERKEAVANNELGQPSLWRHGISGDVPIVMARLYSWADFPYLITLSVQQQYLRTRGFNCHLVILDESNWSPGDDGQEEPRQVAVEASRTAQETQVTQAAQAEQATQTAQEAQTSPTPLQPERTTLLLNNLLDNVRLRGIPFPDGITILAREQLSRAELTLLTAVSQVVIPVGGPSLSAQLKGSLQPPSDEPRVPWRRDDPKTGMDFSEQAGGDIKEGPAADSDPGEAAQAVVESGAGKAAQAVVESGSGEAAQAAAESGAGKAAQAVVESDAGEAPPASVESVTGTVLPQSEDFFVSAHNSEFFNGWGGFVEEGRAYQMMVNGHHSVPRPWANILANPRFGCLITELGTGYTWWRNSRECKLTPWGNDAVLDVPGECVYVRDLDSDALWSATPKPTGHEGHYRVTHGFGYTRIERQGDLVQQMDILVPLKQPVKVIRLHFMNTSVEERHMAVTYYAEWVLGESREKDGQFVVSSWDDKGKILLARNTYQKDFREATAFLHVSAPGQQGVSWTGNRLEFYGPGGDMERPQGLFAPMLSGDTGAFADNCGAVQCVVRVPAQAEIDVMILLGCTDSIREARDLAQQYCRVEAFEAALAEVQSHWRGVTQQVQVHTPDRAMDILLNGWLVYQTVSCRLWARSAFYQAGGAFGFRDQLQDVLALLHTRPDLAREQILLHAAHQYEEGDVQHWWHEEMGKGIRTRFSDDRLWLPYVLLRYLQHTEDWSILQQQVPYLVSPQLTAQETERYENTVVGQTTGTVLNHALRAIDVALAVGEHGLPLMGSGDWNDGMNEIGRFGKGESVWLGWFLLEIFRELDNVNKQYQIAQGGVADSGRQELLPQDVLERYTAAAHRLRESLNEHAWDGWWFRRAYSDDGKWFGSVANSECRIDAIAQSWSVISQGTSVQRQYRAMNSFDRELVSWDFRIARLLWKPFDETSPSPGYIQGYAPGIRENGGQYSHGLIWSVVAWAMLGEGDKAFNLFSLLNPINYTQTPGEVLTYGNEPYVMSADVYSLPPHLGLGGWSWYTGAASWMYQAGLEYILGVQRRGKRLFIRPAVPKHWDGFSVQYRFGGSTFHIQVRNKMLKQEDVTADETCVWIVDGQQIGAQPCLELYDDGAQHRVDVHVSPAETGISETVAGEDGRRR